MRKASKSLQLKYYGDIISTKKGLDKMEFAPIIDKTRQDKARQGKTSNPIVQQHSSNNPIRVIVIGNIQAVINAVNSIAGSKNYVCIAAIIENYAGGKTFLRYLFGAKLSKKLKLIMQAAITSRLVGKLSKKSLRKIPAVYFTSTENTDATFSLIPRRVFNNADLFLLSCKAGWV